MKIKKSNIILIVVAFLFIAHQTVEYIILRQSAEKTIEQYKTIQKYTSINN